MPRAAPKPATAAPKKPRGGARPGAGRKPKAEKYEAPVAEAEKKIVDRLPSLVDNMIQLADGGLKCVEEKFERVHKKDLDGRKMYDAKGDPVYELVLTERKVTTSSKDRQANQYLIDRILGRPTERIETEETLKGKIQVEGTLTLDDLRKLPADELARRYRDSVNPSAEGGK